MYFLMFLMELRRGQNSERWFFIWHPVEMLHLNVYMQNIGKLLNVLVYSRSKSTNYDLLLACYDACTRIFNSRISNFLL